MSSDSSDSTADLALGNVSWQPRLARMNPLRFVRRAAEKLRLVRAATPRPQLEMRWPIEGVILRNERPLPSVYALRQYRGPDKQHFDRLMTRADMGTCPLETWMSRVLPNGLFVIEHIPSANLVAACIAAHSPAR